MSRVSIVVAVAFPAGTSFQPSQLMFAEGADFDEAFASIRSRVTQGVRFDDAYFLAPNSKGTVEATSADLEMHRYDRAPETLVCPGCGSTNIRAARGGEDPNQLTCEKNCYGSGGNPRAIFEGHNRTKR